MKVQCLNRFAIQNRLRDFDIDCRTIESGLVRFEYSGQTRKGIAYGHFLGNILRQQAVGI